MSLMTDRRQERAPAEVAQDGSRPDIYALLGVSSQASQMLARQLYWVRMEECQQAKERGDPGAARAIDELNEALAILLDDRRRAEYDRARRAGRPAGEGAAAASTARRTRAGIVLGIMLATVLVGLAAAPLADPFTLAFLLLGGMLTLVVAVAWPGRVALDSAFTMLGLREDATAREVDIAYELAAQELLTRVKFDRGVIHQLERLDEAYIRVRRILAAREGDGSPARRGFAARLGVAALRIGLAVGAPLVRALGSLALIARLWLARAMTRASRAADERVRATSALGMQRAADYLAALSRQVHGMPEEQAPLALGIDRRTALGLDTFAAPGGRATSGIERDADAGDGLRRAVPAAVEDEDLIEAYVVLEASVGRRRVPIGSAPLRIGSGPSCDLMMAADLGLALEHALVWQREGIVMMHVIDTSAGACLVNGQPMTWASLEHGDAVELARARLSIEVPPPAS